MVAVGSTFGASNSGLDTRFPQDNPVRLNNNFMALTAQGKIKNVLIFDVVSDTASLIDAAGVTLQVTGCVGVALGDYVVPSCSISLQGFTVTAYVQAANVIEFRIQNESTATVDLASATFSALVFTRA